MTTHPRMFELFCEFAAWYRIAQDDVVNWHKLRRWFTMQVCNLGMIITGKLWNWKGQA